MLNQITLRFFGLMQARGLAERVAEDPPTIRLLFRHKNEDQVTGTDQFYSERKHNCCVACGEADHYLRYRVGPLHLDLYSLEASASQTQRRLPLKLAQASCELMGGCGGGCSGCIGRDIGQLSLPACRWSLPATGGPFLCT